MAPGSREPIFNTFTEAANKDITSEITPPHSGAFLQWMNVNCNEILLGKDCKGLKNFTYTAYWFFKKGSIVIISSSYLELFVEIHKRIC